MPAHDLHGRVITTQIGVALNPNPTNENQVGVGEREERGMVVTRVSKETHHSSDVRGGEDGELGGPGLGRRYGS
jgi:hypothetical protein